MRATIRPYNPSTSAKIRIRIMPTKRRGCCAVPLTPASPTTPMAKPAASPDSPTLSPAPSCTKDLHTSYVSIYALQKWKYVKLYQFRTHNMKKGTGEKTTKYKLSHAQKQFIKYSSVSTALMNITYKTQKNWKDASFGADCTNLNEDRPIHAATKM